MRGDDATVGVVGRAEEEDAGAGVLGHGAVDSIAIEGKVVTAENIDEAAHIDGSGEGIHAERRWAV